MAMRFGSATDQRARPVVASQTEMRPSALGDMNPLPTATLCPSGLMATQ
jgi:hypothetical protein